MVVLIVNDYKSVNFQQLNVKWFELKEWVFN
jgi:hypothetical protein